MNNTGVLYENAAVRFLIGKGYRVLQRNYKTRWGEIDIIAEKKGVIHFIEVKGRKEPCWYDPADAVQQRKIKKIRSCARWYQAQRQKEANMCIDVVAITDKPTGQEIQFFENITD